MQMRRAGSGRCNRIRDACSLQRTAAWRPCIACGPRTAHGVALDGRTLFRTTGRLHQVVASPDGRWLVLTWPQADQWLFVPTRGRARFRAVANIVEQLGGAFRVDGWTS